MDQAAQVGQPAGKTPAATPPAPARGEGDGIASEFLDGARGGDDRATAKLMSERRKARKASGPTTEPKKESKPVKPAARKPESQDQPGAAGAAEADAESDSPDQTAQSGDDAEVTASEQANPEAEGDDAEASPGETSEDTAEDKPEHVVVGADGKETKVSLNELKRGYMTQADYTRKTQGIARERRSLQTEQTQFRQAVQNTLPELEVLSRELVTAIAGEERQLEGLRRNDPSEYAARVADIERRRGKLRQTLQKANAIRAQQQQQAQRDFARREAAIRQEEDAKLIQAIPDWASAEKRRAGKGEVLTYLKEQGYADTQLRQLYDHRTFLLARKAMLHDRAQAARKAAGDKRVREATPKPAGARPSPTPDSKSAKVEAARNRLRTSGSLDDAVTVLRAKRAAQPKRRGR